MKKTDADIADLPRCSWAGSDPLYIEYHDREWGIPVHDDRRLFEMLVLEGAQAGLSWITVLRKRENYRKAFDRFDPVRMAKYDAKKVRLLLNDGGIIRNRLKIESAIANAKAFLEVRKEFGSFDAYIWRFAGSGHGSAAMSKDLRKRGFRFVGPTICCSFMQAVGMLNDHEPQCFKRI